MLVLASGECNAEHADKVTIDSLALNERLNEGVPLLDESAELVSGDIHTVEVSVAVESLDFFDLHLHLSPGVLVGLSVQVTQRYLENTTSQAVSGVLYTTRKDINKVLKKCDTYSGQRSCCKESKWVLCCRKHWERGHCTIPS